MSDLSLKVAARFFVKHSGTFEAPPAMLRDIWAWVAKIYTSSVLYRVNSDIREAQDRLKWVEDGIAHNKRVLGTVDREFKRASRNHDDVVFRLVSISRGTWKYLWDYPLENWTKPMSYELVGAKRTGAYSPKYWVDAGARLNWKAKTEYDPVGAAAHVRDRIEKNIAALESAAETIKRLGITRDEDFAAESLVTMHLLRRECLKYTNEAKDYRDQVVEKEFPVDLTGWKYGDKVPEEGLRSIKVVLDFPNKTNDRQKGYWFRLDRAIYLTSVLGSRNYQFGHVGALQARLDEIRDTLRHELQHVAQDIRQVQIMEETGKEDPLLPGISPVKTWEPDQPKSWVTGLPQAPGGGRKEHPLREVEFQTRLADEVAKFKRKVRSIPKRMWKDAFKVWVAMPIESDLIHKSQFFQALKDSEPRKWQKAVKTFSSILHREGVL